MQIYQFSDYLQQLEKTASRNKITEILADLLRKASADEIDKICYLALGELLPAYRGVEFNLAEKMMVRVLARAYGEKEERIRKLYNEKGDLGNVAYASLKLKVKSSKLSVSEVYDRLLEVAKESGEGSQKRKIEKMADLLRTLDPLSAKYAARIPVSKLRLGFSDATILDALSLMERGDKSARKQIEQAYNIAADIGAIAKQVKRHGIASLLKLKVAPGIPIRSSLAERISGAKEIIEKVGPEVAVEQKLDGFRTQIHIWTERGRKEIALFSRNLENTTHMFPEIAASAKKLPVYGVILDGETIGYNQKTGKFKSFQETVQRKRKHGIAEMAKKIPLIVFVFDILYLNGNSLLDLQFHERRKILEKLFKGRDFGAIRLIKQKVTAEVEIIEQELEAAVKAGFEGLVAKNSKALYEAGSRGFHWVKLKPGSAALEKLRGVKPRGGHAPLRGGKKTGLPDTMDCVVMGAYHGRGKRAKFGVGGFLLGVAGANGKYYTISKLGTGLSDEQFREAYKKIRKLEAKEQPKEYVVVREGVPDIWVQPLLVVEVLADKITLSPRHTAGRKKDRGYSLRFPRLVRFRGDKNPEGATTVAEIERIYKLQIQR